MRLGTAPAEKPRKAGLPRHVAIIMDGNGRWARSRGLPRAEGHRRGVQSIRDVVRHATAIGIEWLTVFGFSSENWSRPADEVSELMGLLKLFIRHDLNELTRGNVRVRVIGGRDNLSGDIAALLIEAEQKTAGNTGLNLVIAFNYGSRDEIARATRAIAGEVAAGRLGAEEITVDLVATRLDTAGMPDPDLIIRTSGEQRLSNFLLWQSAYAEFVFVPDYWPDFDGAAFDRAIAEYLGRERRFGGLPQKGEAV
ncbi:isoprenyl transferase [Pleomorphomonas carboxyditropha]|uniref:Isoprenyl transferase n=2 Tax=Pleomorphomonas TaxID=261933 RepID=A0A2G9WY95_9HYPH|nr:isoprenyl transferase [Pleomorphomonas carboxyditropha]PIO99675.1 di-trans,poly-cis-decaprenylcistransferase [Pleomorphomonas carboxyditropha]